MHSPIFQSQDLRAMRSEGAGGQAFFIYEVWHGFLIPGESCCGRFGDCVAGDKESVFHHVAAVAIGGDLHEVEVVVERRAFGMKRYGGVLPAHIVH